MTSWFGSGFSQIKGQLTDLTKEMLDDHDDGSSEINAKGEVIKFTRKHQKEVKEKKVVEGLKIIECKDDLDEEKHLETSYIVPSNEQQSDFFNENCADIPYASMTEKDVGCNVNILKDKLHHLEKVHEKISIDLELTHAADKEKARQLHHQQNKIHSLIVLKDKIMCENDKLKEEKENLIEQLDMLISERRLNLEGRADAQENDFNQRVAIDNSAVSSPKLSGDFNHEHETDGVTNSETIIYEKNLTLVVKELSCKLSECEKEIEQFEMIKSDWQMEKEALEDVLLKLREQVREKDKALKMAELHYEKIKTMAMKGEQVRNAKSYIHGEASTTLDTLNEKVDIEQEGSGTVLNLMQVIDNEDKVMQTQSYSAQEMPTAQEILVISNKHKPNEPNGYQNTSTDKSLAEKDIHMKRFSQEFCSNDDNLEKIVQENKILKLQNIQLFRHNRHVLTLLKNKMQVPKRSEADTYESNMTEDFLTECLQDEIFTNETAFHEMSSLDNENIDFAWSELMRQSCQTVPPKTILSGMNSDSEPLKDEKIIDKENDKLRSSHPLENEETLIHFIQDKNKYHPIQDTDITKDQSQHSIFANNNETKKSAFLHNAFEPKQTPTQDSPLQETNTALECNYQTSNIVLSSRPISKKENERTLEALKEKNQGHSVVNVKDVDTEKLNLETGYRVKDHCQSISLDEGYKNDQLISQTEHLKSQLDIQSYVGDGDNVLKVEIHHLEKQIKDLQLDKEQIMSVLNEKSRECSSLKSEVHHLMTVVSAQKMALNKLQQHKNGSKAEEKECPVMSFEDMTKEAVEKLSHIIRDKDIEMEALNKKNNTLIEVLQQSSSGESQITSFINEKDHLLKQIQVLKCDRENIIATLNTKHKESIKYHDEVQKLTTLLANEKQKNVNINNDFCSLKQQYDDKQHAFLKMQNEMLNYKRKFSELDKKHKDLLKKKYEILSLDSTNSCTQLQMIIQGKSNRSSESVMIDLDLATVKTKSLSGHHKTAASFQKDLDSDDQISGMCIHALKCIEKEKLLEEKSSLIQEKIMSLQDNQSVINAKDKQINELNLKLNRSDEALHIKETELNNLKKHSDNLTFQLNGLQTEVTDLQLERNNLLEKHSIIIQEMNLLRKDNNKLTLFLSDKEFESATTVRTSYALLFEEQHDSDVDEIENRNYVEKLHAQMRIIKQEKDQSMLALQQQQTENHHLQQEIQRLKEKNQKHIKELDRLRGHLMAIEENYTQDALASEERERELRNKLTTLEEKACSSTTAIQSVNLKTFQQIDTMTIDLQTLKDERDKAILERNTSLESATQYSESLRNLQMVLEQFQIERETQQNMELERYQSEIDVYKTENHQLHEQIYDLQVQVNETSDALAAGRRLSEQLDRKEEMIAALREEVQLRETELKKAENDICLLSVSREARVDKELIRNMILGYFHTPVAKQKEAMQLIGRVLDFSDADVKELHSNKEHGWLGGLFKKSPISAKLKHKSEQVSYNSHAM